MLPILLLISLCPVPMLGQVQFKSSDKVVSLAVEIFHKNKDSESFKVKMRQVKKRVRIEFAGKKLKKGKYTIFRVNSCKVNEDSLGEDKKFLTFTATTKSYFTEKSIEGSLDPKDPGSISSLNLVLVRSSSKDLQMIGCAKYEAPLSF